MINFGEKIKDILKENGYTYKIRYEPKGESFRRGKKIVCDYEKITIYAGRNIEKIAQKRSRKLIVFKNEKGEWEGEKDYLNDKEWMRNNARGSCVYELDYHNKTEPLKYTMYSDCDWDDDEKYAKNKMLKILENWSFVEKERTKLKDY